MEEDVLHNKRKSIAKHLKLKLSSEIVLLNLSEKIVYIKFGN